MSQSKCRWTNSHDAERFAQYYPPHGVEAPPGSSSPVRPHGGNSGRLQHCPAATSPPADTPRSSPQTETVAAPRSTR